MKKNPWPKNGWKSVQLKSVLFGSSAGFHRETFLQKRHPSAQSRAWPPGPLPTLPAPGRTASLRGPSLRDSLSGGPVTTPGADPTHSPGF